MIRITRQEFDTFKRHKDPEIFTEKQINSWILSHQETLQKAETDELNEIEKSEVQLFNDEFASFMKVEVVSTSDDILTKGLKYDTYYIREQQIEWDMEKGENDELIKSSHGKYKDTYHNRKMGRVGQEFGHKKEEDEGKNKVGKVEKDGNLVRVHYANGETSVWEADSEKGKELLAKHNQKEDKPEEKKEDVPNFKVGDSIEKVGGPNPGKFYVIHKDKAGITLSETKDGKASREVSWEGVKKNYKKI